MSDDRDPGDEHRDPWPLTCGKVFTVNTTDDAVVTWFGRTELQDGWIVATGEVRRIPLYPDPIEGEIVRVTKDAIWTEEK